MVFRAEASLLLLPKQTLTPDSVRTFALRRGVRGQAGYLDGRPAPPSIPKEKGRTTTLTTLTSELTRGTWSKPAMPAPWERADLARRCV